MKRWLYDTTGIESAAVLRGAGAAFGTSVLAHVVFGLTFLVLGLDEDGAEETMAPLNEMALGAALYLSLLMATAYGGFMAATKAGGQELLHALLAALVAALASDFHRLADALRGSSVDFSISLPHVLAAGIGGFVVLRRRKRQVSENESPGE